MKEKNEKADGLKEKNEKTEERNKVANGGQANGRKRGRPYRWREEEVDGGIQIDRRPHLYLVLFPRIFDGLEDGPGGPTADLQSGHVSPVPPLDQQRRFHG